MPSPTTSEHTTSTSRHARLRPPAFGDSFSWLLATGVFAIWCVISMWQWRNFVAPSWDLGIFTQLLDQYANLNEPIVDIKGPGYNLWGDHFHPILLLLTPLYWLFPSGLTLLVAQNFLFAISIVPVAWYCRRRLGTLVGSLLGLAYALSWGLWNAQWVQFHEISFAVPLLAFGLVAWLEGRRRWALIFIALLVFVKEDLGLTVVAFAAVAFWEDWGLAVPGASVNHVEAGHRRRPTSGRRPSNLVGFASSPHGLAWLGLAVWGAVWFVLTIFVILPAFNTAGRWDYTDRIDSESGASTLAGTLIDLITPEKKLVTVLLLIALGAIVGLRSPIMAMVLPTLLWRFAGNVEHYWGWTWHYSAVLMPIVILAAVDALERIRLPGLPQRTVQRWRVVAAVVSLASALMITVQGSPAGMINNNYVKAPQDSRAALEAIPTSAESVVSDVRHLAYLVPDYRTYWIGNINGVEPDYWISSDEESAAAMAASARERWGGTWHVETFGTVLVASKSDVGTGMQGK